MTSNGLAEPPEGVLAGESVPRENEIDEHHDAKLEQLANRLKAHPRFTGWSTDEIVSHLRNTETK